MKEYDFAGALDFLQYEADITLEELHEEITAAMSAMAALENKRNRKLTDSVYLTLLTCADFIQQMAGKED